MKYILVLRDFTNEQAFETMDLKVATPGERVAAKLVVVAKLRDQIGRAIQTRKETNNETDTTKDLRQG